MDSVETDTCKNFYKFKKRNQLSGERMICRITFTFFKTHVDRSISDHCLERIWRFTFLSQSAAVYASCYESEVFEKLSDFL